MITGSKGRRLRQEACKKSTLTNLYNEHPTWLALAHQKRDAAVAQAYGWPAPGGGRNPGASVEVEPGAGKQFVVPPLGGSEQRPPEGGTTNLVVPAFPVPLRGEVRERGWILCLNRASKKSWSSMDRRPVVKLRRFEALVAAIRHHRADAGQNAVVPPMVPWLERILLMALEARISYESVPAR